jgi:hypothetical protein
VLLAHAVAVLHAAVVLFVLTGSLLALRRPRLLPAHALVALAVLGLYLAAADCPLTDLELWLRQRAGVPPYEGGFLGHYLTEPLGLPIEATSTQAGIHAAAAVPNAVGYSLHAGRALRTRRARV